MLRTTLCGLIAISFIAAVSRAGEVQSAEEKLTLPWHTSEPIYKTQPDNNRALYPKPGSQKLEGNRDFATIILQNQYVKVQAIPELGGVVARAIYKPTGDDFFYFEGRAKDWLPWWESGVKVSFPYYEHGLGSEQPAGYTVIEGPAGERTLAMWMEFSRFTEAYQRKRYGRFSNMMLTQLITVRPDEASFSITYRIVNPAPYKQGRRLWNDTLLPRNQTAQGVVQGLERPPEKTSTEWIFPAAWVSDHGGMSLRPYDESKTALAGYQKGAYSVFAWAVSYGFAGLWYPEASVSRLRLFDPQVAPGAKQYFLGEGSFDPAKPGHMTNACELWGGTDSVFEGIENWLGPGESFAFTHRYALVKGIGKTTWADERLALHAQLDGDKPRIEVVTLKPTAKLQATWDGKPLGEAKCAPDTPAVFALPAGTKSGKLAVSIDGTEAFKGTLPLEIPADTKAHTAIKQSFNGPLNDERRGNADEQGHTYQAAIKGYPDGSVDRGRVLYRDGQIDKAIECLKTATASNADDGEAWHLLGAALLENGQSKAALQAFNKARDAKTPYPAAGYFIALDEIARNERGMAENSLDRVQRAIPSHWESRLLGLWLSATRPSTQPTLLEPIMKPMLAEDPADPRLLWIVREREPYKTRFEQIMKEPGAKPRVEQFEAATKGQYIPPARIK